jgi:hypothetical protein
MIKSIKLVESKVILSMPVISESTYKPHWAKTPDNKELLQATQQQVQRLEQQQEVLEALLNKALQPKIDSVMLTTSVCQVADTM